MYMRAVVFIMFMTTKEKFKIFFFLKVNIQINCIEFSHDCILKNRHTFPKFWDAHGVLLSWSKNIVRFGNKNEIWVALLSKMLAVLRKFKDLVNPDLLLVKVNRCLWSFLL